MSIRLPEPNLFDKLLRLIGKKRGVKIPIGAYDKYGPHFYAVAFRDGFWKALTRPSDVALPDGYVEIFCIDQFFKDIAESAK